MKSFCEYTTQNIVKRQCCTHHVLFVDSGEALRKSSSLVKLFHPFLNFGCPKFSVTLPHSASAIYGFLGWFRDVNANPFSGMTNWYTLQRTTRAFFHRAMRIFRRPRIIFRNPNDNGKNINDDVGGLLL